MILHVDMDAFYASVEQRDRPELKGRPVIVGGTPQGRGVVAAASYEARRFGVHSAMPAATAVRLCPQGVFLRPRIGHYAAVSSQIREIFCRFTPLIEPLSLDEAFLDVGGSVRLFGPPEEIARQIKAMIRGELGLVASVGVAPNKFLAKIASDLEKPDGLVVVRPGGEQAFLDPLPVGRLWGVGKVGCRAFEDMGIRTIGQLRNLPKEDSWPGSESPANTSGVWLGGSTTGPSCPNIKPSRFPTKRRSSATSATGKSCGRGCSIWWSRSAAGCEPAASGAARWG